MKELTVEVTWLLSLLSAAGAPIMLRRGAPQSLVGGLGCSKDALGPAPASATSLQNTTLIAHSYKKCHIHSRSQATSI
jgi:hypothetical protein